MDGTFYDGDNIPDPSESASTEPTETVEEMIAQIPRSPWSGAKTAEAAHAEFGQLPDDTTDPAALAARVPRQIW